MPLILCRCLRLGHRIEDRPVEMFCEWTKTQFGRTTNLRVRIEYVSQQGRSRTRRTQHKDFCCRAAAVVMAHDFASALLLKISGPGREHEFHFVIRELIELENDLGGFGQIDA